MGYGGKNNCARHRSSRPQMHPAYTLQVEWGAIAACLLLGLIVVSPAQSGPGSGLMRDGLWMVPPVWGAVGRIVSGVVVDELPDPS